MDTNKIENGIKEIKELKEAIKRNCEEKHFERNAELQKKIYDLQFEVVGEFLNFEIRKKYPEFKDEDRHKIYELSFKHQYGGRFEEVEMNMIYDYVMDKDCKDWDGRKILPDERESMAKHMFKRCAYFQVGNIERIKVYQ